MRFWMMMAVGTSYIVGVCVGQGIMEEWWWVVVIGSIYECFLVRSIAVMLKEDGE